MTPHQFFGCRGRAEIAGKSHDIATGCGLHFADRLVDADLRAAGDNNARIFAGQACGNREADTGRAPPDERVLTIEVKVHGSSFRRDPQSHTAQQAQSSAPQNDLVYQQFRRYRSESGRAADIVDRSKLTHRVNSPPSIDALRKVHSITSLARASNVGGISKPRILAVCTVSYAVVARVGGVGSA